VVDEIVDDPQLLACIALDVVSLTAYSGAFWLMLVAKFAGGSTGTSALLDVMVVLTAANILLIGLALRYAHGVRQVASQPMQQVDSQHEVGYAFCFEFRRRRTGAHSITHGECVALNVTATGPRRLSWELGGTMRARQSSASVPPPRPAAQAAGRPGTAGSLVLATARIGLPVVAR
jgi:hypothetical protein